MSQKPKDYYGSLKSGELYTDQHYNDDIVLIEKKYYIQSQNELFFLRNENEVLRRRLYEKQLKEDVRIIADGFYESKGS